MAIENLEDLNLEEGLDDEFSGPLEFDQPEDKAIDESDTKESDKEEESEESSDEEKEEESQSESKDKASEDSEKEKSEETEDESNLFDDVELDGDGSEADVVTQIREKVNLPETVKSQDDLIAHINKLENAAKSQADQFANDEMKNYVDSLNNYVKAGGSISTYRDASGALKDAEGKLDQSKKVLETFQSLRSTKDKDKLIKYLIWDEKDRSGIAPSAEDVEEWKEKDDRDLIKDAWRKLDRRIDDQSDDYKSIQKSYDDQKSKFDNIQSDLESKMVSAKKAMSDAIDEYKDEDGEKFTLRTQKIARNLFDGDSQDIKLPKKLVDYLFMDKGKFDPSKIVRLIGTNELSPVKIKHLSKKAKVEIFRKLQDAELKDSTTSNDDGGEFKEDTMEDFQSAEFEK